MLSFLVTVINSSLPSVNTVYCHMGLNHDLTARLLFQLLAIMMIHFFGCLALKVWFSHTASLHIWLRLCNECMILHLWYNSSFCEVWHIKIHLSEKLLEKERVGGYFHRPVWVLWSVAGRWALLWWHPTCQSLCPLSCAFCLFLTLGWNGVR